MEIDRFFVDNTFLNDKQVVYALVDSSEEKVDSFIEIVSSKYPEKSIVEKVKVEDYNGNVMKIESFYRYLTAMQLSKIANYGGKMLEKQDFHIEISRNGFNDMKDELKETRNEIKEMRSDMNEGFAGIKEEVHMQRDDFKEVFMKEVEGLHNEINQIKATLTRMQHGQEL